MSMRDNRVLLVCLLAAMFAIISVANAKAETASTAGSNTAGMNNDSFMKHVHAGYFGNLHGPALNHLAAAETVDQNGNLSKNPMYLDSEVSATYFLTDHIGLGAILPFFLYDRGESAQIGDVGLKVAGKKIISDSDFTFNTNFFVQMSSSNYSKNRGQDVGLKLTPNFRYIIHGTRYSVGAWTEAKAYLGVRNGKAFKLWAAPYLNYQLSPKVSLQLQYELEADHFANKKGGSPGLEMYQNDLMPSVVFMVTPSIMVNPYLQIFTADKINSEHMALGALLSANI